jgi:hypothetical protein
MTVEQIAVRQEVRQMLNEAGINKNTLKELVKEVLQEEIQKACVQAMHEKDIDTMVHNAMNNDFNRVVRDTTKEVIRERCTSIFHRMTISVDITDENGTSSITR